MRTPSKKPSGPCQLCGVKTASSWRHIPSTVPEAAGLSSCNACYVYVLKRVKDDEGSATAALEACRSGKRSRVAPQHSDQEHDEEMSDHDPEPATPPGGASSTATPLQTAAKPVAAALPGGSRPVRGYGSAGMLVAAARPSTQLAQEAHQAQQAQQAQQAHVAQQHAQLARQMQQVQQEQQMQFAQRAQQAQLGMLPQGLLPIDACMQLPAQPLIQPLSPWLTPPQQASMAPWAITQPSSSLSADLLALQDAAWRLSDNPQAAHFAYGAMCQALGANLEQLGVLPALWLLLPGTDCMPQPAGALLLSVHLPPAILPADAQRLLLRNGTGLVRALLLRVYCPYTGQPLQKRGWLQRDERALYEHPHYHVPAWDSSEGWKLLFPKPSSDSIQARLFTAVVDQFGAPSATTPRLSFRVGASGTNPQLGDASSTSTTATASLPHMQQGQGRQPSLEQQQQQQQQPQQPEPAAEQRQSARGGRDAGQPPHHAMGAGQQGQQAAPAPPIAPPPADPEPGSIRHFAVSLQQQLAEQQRRRQGALGRAASLPSSLVVPEDVRAPPTGLCNQQLAAEVLNALPPEMIDEDMLTWILSLGSGAAPGSPLLGGP